MQHKVPLAPQALHSRCFLIKPVLGHQPDADCLSRMLLKVLVWQSFRHYFFPWIGFMAQSWFFSYHSLLQPLLFLSLPASFKYLYLIFSDLFPLYKRSLFGFCIFYCASLSISLSLKCISHTQNILNIFQNSHLSFHYFILYLLTISI